ncbi:hypothetical protein AHAS_Ahas19G0216600 [Arachis hypogaea]
MTDKEPPSSRPHPSSSRPQGRATPSSRPSKDNDLSISHKDVLANICENISLMDGVTVTTLPHEACDF